MLNILLDSNSNSSINKPVFIILLVSSITLLFFSLLEFIIFCINQKFSLFKKKSFDLKTILINLAIICLSILVLAILLIHFFDAEDKSKLFLLITWSLTIFLFIFSFLFKFAFIKFLNKNKYDQSDLSKLPLNEILRKFKLEKYINFDFNLLNSNDK
jgi:amino acid transporter